MRKPLKVNTERLIETMREQALIGAVGSEGLCRLALTDADKQARDWLRAAMVDAGLTVRVDAIGNMFGERPGAQFESPVLIGSHLDSQPNAGIFDGALGVVAALEVIRTLNDHGILTRRPVEVVNWTNEEGSRFQPGTMGSGVWAGIYELEEAYNRSDRKGLTVLAELQRIGYHGDLKPIVRVPYRAYLELHIEQGPRLEHQRIDIGIVTGVVGIYWGEVVFTGESNHAGTTPMHLRRDALVGAAELVSWVRSLPPRLGGEAVATIGSLSVSPNSVNVIPGEVRLTLDLRDPEGKRIEEACRRVARKVMGIGRKYGLQARLRDLMLIPPVRFSESCLGALRAASDLLGYRSVSLVSYAGHDAQQVARVVDAAMVFVPSRGGKSHCPDEHTSWEDCAKGANVLLNAVAELAGLD